MTMKLSRTAAISMLGSILYRNKTTRASSFLLKQQVPLHAQSFAKAYTYRPLAFFSSSTASASSSSNNNGPDKERLFPEEINIIYDSKCNVCNLEIEFLRRRDMKLAEKRSDGAKGQPRLKFTDLESGTYNPKAPENGGVTYESGMKSMHAITADGKIYSGIPVFQMAYEQVNLGWLFAVTKIKSIKRVADWVYNVFAKYRTNVTRGQNVDSLIKAYEEKQALDYQKNTALEDCNDACTEKVTSK